MRFACARGAEPTARHYGPRGDMGMTTYRVLVADPPWKFGDRLNGTRGAERNYKTMPVEDIRAFPLPPLCVWSHLFLWRVAAMQDEALSGVRSWGFVPKAEIVWPERTIQCKRWLGMGRR